MKISFLLLLTMTSFCLYGQHTANSFADTAYIYKGFGAGGTTANLRYYSKAVDTMQKVSKLQLDALSLDSLNYLIRQVQPKRHFQQKIGTSYYATVIKNRQWHRLAIVPNWGIIDLTNNRQYVFKLTPYAEIYQRFVNKIYR
jgi:hypothetical protein